METKIEEIWKDVPNSSRYKVSSIGRVWDNEKSALVIQKVYKGGYPYVNIQARPQIKYGIAVHRLVLWAFFGVLTDKFIQCNHKDGNKQNNNLSNLEAVTPGENLLHAYKLGLNPGAWTKYKKKFGLWSERQKAAKKPNKYDYLRGQK